jgi:hypothetical protein
LSIWKICVIGTPLVFHGTVCGGRALDAARGQRQMPILLRDHLQFHLQAVLLEEACLVGQRQRRKPRPARHTECELGRLGVRGRAGHDERGGKRKQSFDHREKLLWHVQEGHVRNSARLGLYRQEVSTTLRDGSSGRAMPYDVPHWRTP